MLTTIFFLMALVYFCYHAMSGEGGLFALVQLSNELDSAQVELDEVRAERLKLAYRTELLKPESLDLDLLDEQTRKVLGYAHPEERVYTIK